MRISSFLLAAIALQIYGVVAVPDAELVEEPAVQLLARDRKGDTSARLGRGGRGNSTLPLSGAIDGAANAQNPASFGGHTALPTDLATGVTAPAPTYPAWGPRVTAPAKATGRPSPTGAAAGTATAISWSGWNIGWSKNGWSNWENGLSNSGFSSWFGNGKK